MTESSGSNVLITQMSLLAWLNNVGNVLNFLLLNGLMWSLMAA